MISTFWKTEKGVGNLNIALLWYIHSQELANNKNTGSVIKTQACDEGYLVFTISPLLISATRKVPRACRFVR
jgi:hypothetical protein